MGVALGERMYVKRLDKENNRVEIAPRPGVSSEKCIIRDVHWINEQKGKIIRCKSKTALWKSRFMGKCFFYVRWICGN